LDSNHKRLGVALVGAGFINSVHAKAWLSVRDAEIVAICSPTAENANKLAAVCRDLGVGRPKIYSDLRETVNDQSVDAVWVSSPNYARFSSIRAIAEEVREDRSNVRGIACEKPLAASVLDAKEMLRLVEDAGILHGYLENQVFAPSLTRGKEIVWKFAKDTGRPYLARAAEEHGGPHSAWFWVPQMSGGGVVLDMMCHSLEASRFMLTSPDETREQLRVRTVSGEVASLKWTRPEYVEELKKSTGGRANYSDSPAEDFGRATVTFEAADGNTVIADASVLWCYTGPGVRLILDLLGPEYYMSVNSLQPDLHVFSSRNVKPKSGVYFVEKQAAEQGLMPTVADESFTYGFQAEDRHMVQSFIQNKMPMENWHDGLAILEIIMACYMAAEKGKRLKFQPGLFDDYVPQPARGKWNPDQNFTDTVN
jgi:predicted dehydrogenase